MITINSKFLGFKNLFKNLIPVYIRENDSYKNPDKEGLFERYMALFGESIDNEQANQIENYLNILDSSVAESKHLSHISDVLGNPPDIFKDINQYRNLLSYIVNVYKVKGTSEGYKLFFYILGFDVSVENLEPLNNTLLYDEGDEYDTEELIYDPETCVMCSYYNIIIRQITGAPYSIDGNTIQLLNNAISFNEPINAKLKSFVIVLLVEDTITISSLTETVTTTLGAAPQLAPTASLVWGGSNGADKQVNTETSNQIISLNSEDYNNDIVTRLIQYSTNLGNTWQTLVANQPDNNPLPVFIDTVDMWYRAIVTDSLNNSVTTNVLKYHTTYVYVAQVAPTVSITWDDLSNTDKVTNQSTLTYEVFVTSADTNNDIVKREVLRSTNGTIYTVMIADLTTATFGDTITTGNKYYKVKVTDSVGNITYSNVLKYSNIYVEPVEEEEPVASWEASIYKHDPCGSTVYYYNLTDNKFYNTQTPGDLATGNGYIYKTHSPQDGAFLWERYYFNGSGGNPLYLDDELSDCGIN